MSGPITDRDGGGGWEQPSRQPSRQNDPDDDPFAKARSAYGAGYSPPAPPPPAPPTKGSAFFPPVAPVPGPVRPAPATGSVLTSSRPGATHALMSSARHVIVIVQDTTLSMETFVDEFFLRAPAMHREACAMLEAKPEEVEVLYIGVGDARRDGRCFHPLQVTQFGHGPEIDGYMRSIYVEGGGGGNGGESTELALYYLLTRVDWSASKNIHVFVVTNEPAHAGLHVYDPKTLEKLFGPGIQLDPTLSDTGAILEAAKRRFSLNVILGSYDKQPDNTLYGETDIDGHLYYFEWWAQRVGPIRIQPLPIKHARRGTDVVLLTLAIKCGKVAEFEAGYLARQGHNPTNQQKENTAVLQTALNNTLSLSQLLPPKGTMQGQAASQASVFFQPSQVLLGLAQKPRKP